MGISPYLQGLREQVGHELLLIPAVAVLPWDADGRLLLARERETRLWQTVGGSVEPDESPHEAALREAMEEAGVTVQIDRIRTVVGGSQFRMRYPNGDVVSYVSTVFDAHVVDGEPRADGEEASQVGWFTVGDLRNARLTPFTLALFAAAEIAGPAGGQRVSTSRLRDT